MHALSLPPRPPARPAWIEIDLARLRQNVRIVRQHLPPRVQLLAVVKDDAYGHGAVPVARVALAEGATFLGCATLDEALALRAAGIRGRILLLGERAEAELPWCMAHDLTVCVNHASTVRQLARLAAAAGRRVPVHVKINTGMNRYGVRWDAALPVLEAVLAEPALRLEGVLTHFAQSDEADKTFALLQMARFDEVMAALARGHPDVRPWQHLCNSGGFLDLPQAHRDLVRVGILLYGIFPSTVCRRLPGLMPVMSVKARVAALQSLQPGDSVGYGMRFTATRPTRIAVLPLGYGDGFPRVRNEGEALLQGRPAPIVGGVTMDALMVDVTHLPAVQPGEEAVLLGEQGNAAITARDVARLKNSVTYDVLTGWQSRLPRRLVDAAAPAAQPLTAPAPPQPALAR
jgi:alanine racemase